MKKFHGLLMVTLLAVVFGCGGQGPRKVRGAECKAKVDPTPMELKPKQEKISLDNSSDIPEGVYTYQWAKMAFKVPSRDLMVVIEDRPEKANSSKFVGRIGCVRGIPRGLPDMELDVEGVHKIVVHPFGNYEIEKKKYGFTVKGTKLASNLSKTEKSNQRPGAIYAGKALEYFLVKMDNKGNYELRSSALAPSTLGGDSMMYLRIGLKKRNPKPKQAPPL